MMYIASMSRQPTPNPLDMVARGGRLKAAMNHRSFNTTMLSRWTGISDPTIRRFLAGDRDMHLDDLQKIGSALGVSPSWIAWGQR